MKKAALTWLIREGSSLASDFLRIQLSKQSRVAIQNKIVKEEVASPLTAPQELQKNPPTRDAYLTNRQRTSEASVTSATEEVNNVADTVADSVAEIAKNEANLAEIAESGMPTPEQTLAYQNGHITNQLLLMAVHYVEKLKMNGIPCDCLPKKHFKILKAFIQETIPMVEDPDVYYRLIDWLEEVAPKSSYEANKSGLYDDEYPGMAYEARQFVKEIDPDRDSTSLSPSPQEEAVITGSDILPVVSDEEKEKIRQAARRRLEEVLR